MPTSCVAVGCANRHKKGSGIHFFRFPREEDRRKLWLLKIKRDRWIPKEGDRICSDHFLSGKPSINRDHPDYCPSVFVFTKGGRNGIERFKRKERRQLQCDTSLLGEDEVSAEEEEDDSTILVEISPKFKDAETQTDDLKEDYQREIEQMATELNFLRQERDELRRSLEKSSLNVKKLTGSNIKFYTGLSNINIFLWVVKLVGDSLRSVTSLTKEDQVFMTLMKLRLGLLNEDLARRFCISSATVSRVLTTTIPILASRLRILIRWPSREHVRKTLPKCFRKHYQGCRVIIDCSEVFIERPLNLKTRAQTFSSYKQHNTLKFLLGITPYGAVSFLSECWGGRISDKELVQRSGFYDILEPGDVVMADRGFTIANEIAFHHAKLVIPPFTRGRKQLPGQVMEDSRRLSSARIHVERAIERIKNFRILKCTLTPNLAKSGSDIVSICASLINLQGKLISK